MRDVLNETIKTFSARAGGALVVDAHNGEILALVSLPDFDANAPMRNGQDSHFNRMTLGVYELGSIFKVFTAAMALDSGMVAAHETFDTAEPLQIGRHEINDLHGEERPLSIEEIIVHSSNIVAKLALRVPEDVHYDFLQRLGFTDTLDMELPERTAPLTPTRWTDIERATSSYGHGISVTPLHAVMAGAAMVNGGILYQPSLRKVGLPVGERVISAQTSAALRAMMRAVVAAGTGRQANAPGYQVLGKTGSAEKPQAGGYNKNALVTSFLGAFPARAPRYAMLVMLDEPQATQETHGYNLAGWNAAPAAGEIVRRIAPLLGVLPHFDNPAEQASLALPEISNQLREAWPMRLDELTHMKLADATMASIDICGISADSRTVQPGYLFAALAGVEADGRSFVGQAIENGAAAILTQEPMVAGVPVVTSDNPRRDLALMAARFFRSAAAAYCRHYRHEWQNLQRRIFASAICRCKLSSGFFGDARH